MNPTPQTPIAPVTPAPAYTPVPAVNTTIDASRLSGGTTPMNIPPAPTDTTDYNSTLSGIIAGLQKDKAAADAVVSPIQQEQTGLIDRIKSLMGTDAGKSADQASLESAADITGQQKGIQELTNQITQLAAGNQAQKLTIEGQGGVSNGVISSQSIAQDRQTAIKAITLNAALQAKQGNLSLAQDQISHAIDLKYKPIEDEINYKLKLLDLNRDSLSAAEKKQADAQSSLLNTQLQQAQDAKANESDIGKLYTSVAANGAPNTVLATIAEAMKKGDKNAAYVAAGPYLKDPNAALDTENKQLQNQKLRAEIAAAKQTGSASVAIVNDNGDTVSVPTDVAPYYNVSSSGVQYIDASTLQGTAAQKTSIINQATKAGYKVITNKNTAADLVNIKDAKSKLDTVSTIMAGIGQPGWITRALYGAGLTKLAAATQSDPQKAAAGALESIGLDVLKAISGVQGFRGNQAAIQQVTDHLPKVTDTIDTINQKVSYIDQLISDREDAAVGKASDTGADQVVNGVTYAKGPDGLYYPKK